MKNTLLLFVAALAACGTVTPADDSLDGVQAPLAVPPFAPPAWYSLGDDAVTALNSGATMKVGAFLLVDPALDAPAWKHALSAPGEVLVLGRLRLRTFEVHAAYRALPGVLPVKASAVYQPAFRNITCFVAPCPVWQLDALDGSADTAVEALDLTNTLRRGVDEAWLRARIEQGRTVLAGVANAPWSLDVRALYLRLPERAVCPQVFWRPGCQKEEVAVYTRDAERCLDWAGCAAPGPCIEKPASCEKGYAEVRFAMPPNACEVVRCDPDFAE